MSSILKALRKLEDEKAVLGQGSVNLAHDILKRSHTAQRTILWPVLAVGGVLLLVVGGGLIYLPERSPQPATPIVQRSELPASQPQTIPLRQAEPVSKPLPKPQPTAAPPPTVHADKPELEATPPQSRSLASGEKSRPAAAVVAPAIAIPELRVDAIIYHQQPSARLAVINDLPVMEGTDINGVRVEEILPAAVRFSYRGVQFRKFVQTSEK